MVRTGPFFDMAHRVIETDRKRQATMNLIPDISPLDPVNALARVGENNLTIAWVQTSLAQRCASYRFALDHLVVSEPTALASQVDTLLKLLQQEIAANQLVPLAQFAPGADRRRGAAAAGRQITSPASTNYLSCGQWLDATLRAGERASRHRHKAGFRR